MNAKPTKPAPSKPTVDWDAYFAKADYSVPIPVNLPTPKRSNALPFKGWFDKVAEAAVGGKEPHRFLPNTFWVGRDVPEDKATASYSKGKVRDQFSAWKKQEGHPKSYQGLILTTLERTGGEGIEGIKEPGISIWVRFGG